MIVFDLECRDGGERFEAWFRSGADFEAQVSAGLVGCPFCASTNVAKAPMAPSVGRKGRGESPLETLAKVQAELLKDSRWVGGEFADQARAMHSGDIAPERVHGHASGDEARALAEEGVRVAPLPLPVIPPDSIN